MSPTPFSSRPTPSCSAAKPPWANIRCKCVEVFDRIAQRIERSGGANFQERAELTSPRQKLVKSAVVMADELKADAILVFTIRGNMARHTAWMRPRHSPIYAVCETQAVADSLTINWGVTSIVIPFDHADPEKTIFGGMVSINLIKGLKRKNTYTYHLSPRGKNGWMPSKRGWWEEKKRRAKPESGAKDTRSPDASRLSAVLELREAFGVRRVHRRFSFEVRGTLGE